MNVFVYCHVCDELVIKKGHIHEQKPKIERLAGIRKATEDFIKSNKDYQKSKVKQHI